ncbi:CDP-glycerol glycerophosphotransferase family protein [Mesobacillus jeotgali]|uniref:CDP-glycerol glycerophosphotransferase family protein n=1 Tax=Mesobacillus jeotgali TaxID=129985 RepID=UPI0009A6F32D|nr:CDP-glycerol glycerophosphotransferase family protein [Mesobacillus jeotgali]
MIREFSISVYLILFKLIFSFFKLFPLKNKVTFVVSFGDNAKYVLDELKKGNSTSDIVCLYTKPSVKSIFEGYSDIGLIPFESKDILKTILSIYHLATSKYIIIDNYYGFLAATEFKPGVECVQLWHAAGAVKKFALEDQSNASRSQRANERFLKVYRKFDKVVVGSDAMAAVFMKAFGIPSKNILRTGIPRTDFFFDKNKKKQVIEKLESDNPDLKSKKVLLYAPTYRDGELEASDIKLDLARMQKELGDDYIVLLRLHPAIRKTFSYNDKFPGFVYDYSGPDYDVNELLLVTDILISDYSSIPYEFALLNKPMIFYAYDLEEYTKSRGLWENYSSMVPGPMVKETADIIKVIKKNQFDLDLVRDFSKKWNKYSNGNSSLNLVNYISSPAEENLQKRETAVQ